MKRKGIFLILIIVAVLLVGTAYAEESDCYESYIVRLKPKTRLFGSKSGAENETGKDFILVPKDEIDKYLDDGIVGFYEPNYEITLFEDFGGENMTDWNLKAIKVQKAWNIGCYGNDIKVAVIDSGAYAHPDIAANLYEGYNYIDDNTDTSDNIGHGTYVSGIIAASANGEYIDGVASRAKIVPLKCFDKGKTTEYAMLVKAIYDAVDKYDADVINMSFGAESSSETFHQAIDYAVEKGCIVVTAVGNDGNGTVYYPANYDGVIGVGSVEPNLTLSYFSQRNATVDVVAPGGSIESVSIEGYKNNSGTSFAVPHVSAMAAIAKCIDKSITASEFQALIEETSKDLGEEGYDTSYGYGLINIEAMTDKLLENKAVFMSPVDDKNENVTVTVYNNSGNPLTAVGLAAVHENGILTNTNITDINLSARETVKITAEKGKVKFMLWESLKNMLPLTQFRCFEAGY